MLSAPSKSVNVTIPGTSGSSTGCPIHEPGSNPAGASTLPETTFQSIPSQSHRDEVTLAALSALPFSKSIPFVEVLTVPAIPKIS